MSIPFLMLALLLWTEGAASQETKPLSPLDSVSLQLDTNRISIVYCRPSMRGRVIMGGLVPWEKVWRTGANEATLLRTSFDMLFGDVPVPRGSYTVWTIPGKTTWTVIINKETGQWGTRYNPSLDLARFTVPSARHDETVQQFTIGIKPAGPSAGSVTLVWENTIVTIPFQKNDRIRPLSPTDSTDVLLGEKRVKIIYSRPFSRGREIWGTVVPYDSVWRTGANAATVLRSEVNLRVGGVRVPAGTYTLYSIPHQDTLTLIVSRKPPGAAQYDRTQDLARIPLAASVSPKPIDPFTILLQPGTNGSATLKIGWDTRVYAAGLQPE